MLISSISAAPARAALVALVALSAGAAPLLAQAPDTDIWVASLVARDGAVIVGQPRNVTHRPGYDNQPAFLPDGRSLLYVAQHDEQTDVYELTLATNATRQLTQTPESEYSPIPTANGRAFTVVRVERDSAQRLWRFSRPRVGTGQLLLPHVQPVGYHAWTSPTTVTMFVLGEPSSLQVARVGKPGVDTIVTDIGRSLQTMPGGRQVSFVQRAGGTSMIKLLDPATGAVTPLFPPLAESDDLAWANAGTVLMASGSRIYAHQVADGDQTGDGWTQVADLGPAGVGRITRLAVSARGDQLAFVAQMAGAAPAGAAPAHDTTHVVREADVRRALTALAADSMEGRRTGTVGEQRAARMIAAEFRRLGLVPAGDSGSYLQRVPLAQVERNGRPGLALLPDWAAWDTVAQARRASGANVVGYIRGTDPAVRDEHVLVDAHYDHLGIRGPGVNGDSIFNGADDDASGVVAVLEIARALAANPPRRTVVFSAMTGEEMGLLGTRWYIEHPPFPLERMAANLEIEMIGRPDSLAGGAGRAWLTGYERSTMGDALRAGGVPIVADPRPTQNFFERSDNIAFARRGIPAHTISSYNMHAEYHTPDDEVERVDFAHMTRVIQAAVAATRILADGAKPEWKPGGQPPAVAPRRQ
ncbi:MAG TPA: M20/M25/M40 family metallo-hydrolase [Gemmatimonadaceae bacterium]|nr:M20/M25/M40 family metallo-hydrolase [Gemmatimonadaceae bacterium]